MLTIASLAELILVIGLPIGLGFWLRRRLGVSWLYFLAGALTFGVSQAVHLPLNQGISAAVGGVGELSPWAEALILGFTAGLCEETARYAAYRWVLPDLRRWREAVMYGAGHGGIESVVLVGLMVGAAWLNMTVLGAADLTAWGLPAGQVAQLQGQLDTYWGQEWFVPLLAAVERLLAIVFHIGMAVLVLQAVLRLRPLYWLLAIGLHTAVNAAALLTVEAGWSLAATEGVIGLFALVALGIVIRFRETGAEEAVAEPARALPPLPIGSRRPVSAEERLRRQIEESRWERGAR
jgi:uncharacterized membrane protein YhfC